MPPSTLRPVRPAVSLAITRHLEIDGVPVGPNLAELSDLGIDDSEAAHRWMASNHPGTGYSIVSASLGRCCRRVSYAPAPPSRNVD